MRPPRPSRQVFCLSCVGLLAGWVALHAQEPPAPQAVSAAQLKGAIDKLGDLDYPTRTAAARTVRRTAAAQAVPVLARAVSEHADGYVRYRALVLLTGFNDPRTADSMREALASPNDRLRAVAYSFFERHPDPAMVPGFLAALDTEAGEFVRPALVRALAAAAAAPAPAMASPPAASQAPASPGSSSRGGRANAAPASRDQAPQHAAPPAGATRVQQALVREVGRGQDFFRSSVIEALGEYKAQYAYDAVLAVAKQDGPLQVDAAIALGRIGDARALETLAALQRSAPRASQPSVAAAICLLGVNCGSHENYLIETLKFSDKNVGFQELTRGAASGLGALGVAGRAEAVTALFDIGIPSQDPARAPIALALGTIALRNTPLMLSALAKTQDRAHAIELVGEGFDMLEEDLDKERVFALVRHTYWQAAEGSPERQLMQTLIQKLDF